jgi:nucleoside-diphosphate-sugar epimerase
MKEILLTGATGFVGSEVLRQLIERGMQVTALGRRMPEADVKFIRADITDVEGLNRVLPKSGFDAVMHIASLPGDTGNPSDMVNVNVNGCLNMMEYARRSGAKRFVLASSISAYEWYPATKFNPPDYLPVDEEHPCRPKDIYATTKRMQELLAVTYNKQYGIETCVLRLTAVIGPDGKGGAHGWGEIAQQMAEGRVVKIPHLSADEMCHYVDIRDVARMFIAAAEHPGAAGQVFNCCGPKAIRGYNFEEIIKKLIPGIEVEYGFPWSMAQGGEICFDMSKAKKVMDFEPLYSVKDSIKNIIKWIYKTNKDSHRE